MISKIKLNIYNLLTYAMIFAIIKPYFLPEWLRKGSKIAILLFLLFFIVSKTPKDKVINISVLFSGIVWISAVVAFFRGNYQAKDLMEAFLYGITFYDIYSFVSLCKQKKHFYDMLKCIYNINMLYCLLTLLSVMLVGIADNSNKSVYFFGNKFTSSYLFILLTALYGATHNTKIWKNRVFHMLLFVFSIFFTHYIGCDTATVSLVILFVIILMPSEKLRLVLISEKVVTVSLIASGVAVIWMNEILKNEFINNIVFGYFGKTITVTGRLEIYNVYLMDIISGRFWLGYGYSNSIIKNLSGLYANAQNGLFEIMVNEGFLGVTALLVTVFFCFKKTKKDLTSFYIAIVVYGMIIASIFEISLNWFFLLGICLIRWNCNSEAEKNK